MDYRLLSIALLSVVTGCAGQGAGSGGDARLSRAMASLMETAEVAARAGCDSASARAKADSALGAEGMTRAEFLGACRALDGEPERWRGVSEDAAKILEQRIASRGGR